jgi:hypothetical protein
MLTNKYKEGESVVFAINLCLLKEILCMHLFLNLISLRLSLHISTRKTSLEQNIHSCDERFAEDDQLQDSAILEGDDTLDQLLRKLVEKAKKYPVSSTERKNALNNLIREISNSGRLGHPHVSRFPSPNVYRDYYNEALQRTWEIICKKVENYNPKFPVMAWVNFTLNKQVLKVQREFPLPVELPDNDPPWDPSDFSNELCELRKLLLRKFIKDDPKELLRAKHIREHPNVTFQSLLWARDVEGKKWVDISKESGITIQTLSAFYKRNLEKLMPDFKKYFKEQLGEE